MTDKLNSLSNNEKEEQITPNQNDSPDTGQVIQRCVIIQRDEKGYGLTVSGDNPVFVQSVKPEGAAARSGVQQGDKIIKVNGTLVTSSNHLEVVKLIKSGSYVALTLLGKPSQSSTPTNRHSVHLSSSLTSDRDSLVKVTNPQPVDAEKDKELKQQKVHTLRAMYEQAVCDYEKLKKSYIKNPTEKLHTNLVDKEKTLKALSNQLKNLTGTFPEVSPLTSMASVSSPEAQSEQTQDIPPVASWLHGHPRHIKQKSVPATLYKTSESSETTNSVINVSRSKSDVTTSRLHVIHTDSRLASYTHIRRNDVIEGSIPPSISDGGSMSESPPTSPNTSPTPIHPFNHKDCDQEPDSTRRDSGILEDSSQLSQNIIPPSQVNINIISTEDDEFTDEEYTEDHGLFNSMELLKEKPAHLAIFMHYLISNCDPSSLFFYVVSDIFSHTPGNTKELRKWAYEIHSTFLTQNAPLKVTVEEPVINKIDDTLQSKYDKEENIRKIFESAREIALGDIEVLLQDFCHKKDLGLGNIYGSHELKDNMDKNVELKTIEKYLIPHLERFNAEEDATAPKRQRDQAMGWALATFLRQVGVQKTSHSNIMDRAQSFVTKEKKLKLPGAKSRPKHIKGHQFQQQHYYTVTLCNHCATVIWGVGYQGFQCSNCEQNFHRQCIDDIEEACGGSGKKGRAKRSSTNIRDFITRKPSHTNTAAATTPSTSVKEALEKADQATSPTQMNISMQPQPLKEEEDEDLSSLREGKDGHSVQALLKRYEPSSNNKGHKKKGSDIGRSESFKGRVEHQKGDKPARRAKSDVDMDENTIKALNQSGSSSASSLSAKSIDSPSNSSEAVNELSKTSALDDSDLDVEPELPPLDSILNKEILKKLKPKEKKRQEVLNELCYTERAHVRILKILDKLFNQPMLLDNHGKDLAHMLFPNLDKLIELHCSLNSDMRARRQKSPVVHDVGDILLKRFDGEAGEEFRNSCAIYCRNQSFGLEFLRQKQRKDARVSQIIMDSESNPLCRRLQLKDIIPAQMQRLTKYRLLIENLLKYTQTNTDEYSMLERAFERLKSILEYVNQAVKDCENHNKLLDMQKRLDKRAMENTEEDYVKNLDFRRHKLVHEGMLAWRFGRKPIELQVVLLEDLLVLLQKQDDKLLLKCQNPNIQPGLDNSKYTHNPVLPLNSLLTKNNATDKRAFFLVSTSKAGPQIYELVAPSIAERNKWFTCINQAIEQDKHKQQKKEATPKEPEELIIVRDKIKIAPKRDSSPEPNSSFLFDNKPEQEDDEPDHAGFEKADEISGDTGLVNPENVTVSDAIMGQAESVLSPIAAAAKALQDDPNMQLPIPMDKLKDMASRMNCILTTLLATVNSRDEERDEMRHKLQSAQDELNLLREIQKASGSSVPSSQSRPHSFMSVSEGSEGSMTASDVLNPIENEEDTMDGGVTPDTGQLESSGQFDTDKQLLEIQVDHTEVVTDPSDIVMEECDDLEARTVPIVVLEPTSSESCDQGEDMDTGDSTTNERKENILPIEEPSKIHFEPSSKCGTNLKATSQPLNDENSLSVSELTSQISTDSDLYVEASEILDNLTASQSGDVNGATVTDTDSSTLQDSVMNSSEREDVISDGHPNSDGSHDVDNQSDSVVESSGANESANVPCDSPSNDIPTAQDTSNNDGVEI